MAFYTREMVNGPKTESRFQWCDDSQLIDGLFPRWYGLLSKGGPPAHQSRQDISACRIADERGYFRNAGVFGHGMPDERL